MRISDWSSDVCSSDLQGEPQFSGCLGLKLDFRRAIFTSQSCNHLLGRHNLADHTDALSASPYVPPRFDLQLFSRSEVELGRITSRQIVGVRSEEHTSELQSLMRISYAVFCLKKKTNTTTK